MDNQPQTTDTFKRMHSMTFIHRPLLCAALAALIFPTAVLADAVWISSGGGNPLKYPNVTIEKIEKGSLVYRTAARETHKAVADVVRIEVDSEPALNSAEAAYEKGNWSDAVDGYLKTVNSTNKEWLKNWADVRLLQSADKAHRFDAAATAYLQLVITDPLLAAKLKPAMPDAKSTYLDTAAAQAEQAAAAQGLNEDQKRAIYTFLLDLYRTQGDSAKALSAADRLAKLGGATPQAQASVKIGMAQIALDNKLYPKALALIEDNRGVFIDPTQQADALFIIAEAKQHMAAKDDKKAQMDAALAYMRVVANFENLDTQPHIAVSLLRTADILAQLNDTDEALRLYNRLATDYATKPEGQQARQKADELKAKAKAAS
jgi:hypothetical protein